MTPRPRSRLLLLLLAALFSAAPARAAAAPPPPPPGPAISPYLVGNNVWYNNPAPWVWDFTREARVRLLRIGGAGYDRRLPDDATLIAWVKQIRAVGAEPLLQVSQYADPARAVSLVDLFNRQRAAGEPIRYWSIGNEPWLQSKRPRPKFPALAPSVAANFKKTSAAMKEADPSIKIFGVDECDIFKDFHEALFGPELDLGARVPGKPYHYIDGITWHHYPQTDNEPGLAEIENYRGRSRYARQLVDRVNQRHNRTGDQALVWALTEFNAKSGAQVHTWGNGQMFGAIYGIAMEQGAFTATTWSMYENGGSRKGTDFSFLDGPTRAPRATYWHMRLISEHFHGRYVGGESPEPSLTVYGAQDGARLAVMIMNHDPVRRRAYRLLAHGESARALPTDTVALRLATATPLALDGEIGPRTTRVLLRGPEGWTGLDYSAEDFAASRPPSPSFSAPLPRATAPLHKRWPARAGR